MENTDWSCREISIKCTDISAPKYNCRNTLMASEVIRNSVDMDNVSLQEHFWAIYMAHNLDVIGFRTINIGNISSVNVDTLSILRNAILLGSKDIILAHNHPSGNLNPSANDVFFTEKIVKAASVLGINVLDHIIMTRYNFVSMGGERFFEFKSNQFSEYYAERNFKIDENGHLAQSMRPRPKSKKAA